jgi:hypothetical protein
MRRCHHRATHWVRSSERKRTKRLCCPVTVTLWTRAAPFTELSPSTLSKPVTQLRRHDADTPGRGRPWTLPLADRVLLIPAYWGTDLTLRQPAPLSGVLKSPVSRVIDHLGQKLALEPRKRFAKDAVLIV